MLFPATAFFESNWLNIWATVPVSRVIVSVVITRSLYPIPFVRIVMISFLIPEINLFPTSIASLMWEVTFKGGFVSGDRWRQSVVFTPKSSKKFIHCDRVKITHCNSVINSSDWNKNWGLVLTRQSEEIVVTRTKTLSVCDGYVFLNP